MKKILILVNTLQNVPSFIYSNHIEFFTKTTKKFGEEIQLIFFTPHRMSIDNARNTAAKLALENECDYLMFIDDDVMIPPNTLELLLEADKDIVAGLVIIRGYPFNVMAFKWKEDEPNALTYYNDLPKDENGELQTLVPCPAVGFSCALIKIDVLKAMPEPYFVTGKFNTEDVYFCLKTRELEPNPTIFIHTGVRCGHLLNPEPIEWGNREKMMEFYKPLVQANVEEGRGPAYIEKCLAALGVSNES